jgi:hypothetical protein
MGVGVCRRPLCSREVLFEGASKTPLDLSEADTSALFAPLRSEPTRRAA